MNSSHWGRWKQTKNVEQKQLQFFLNNSKIKRAIQTKNRNCGNSIIFFCTYEVLFRSDDSTKKLDKNDSLDDSLQKINEIEEDEGIVACELSTETRKRLRSLARKYAA